MLHIEEVGQRSDLDVGEPGFHSLEALLHGDIIHHHHTICFAEELLGDAAVPAAVTEVDSSPLTAMCPTFHLCI